MPQLSLICDSVSLTFATSQLQHIIHKELFITCDHPTAMASLLANPFAYIAAPSSNESAKPETTFPLVLELSKDGIFDTEVTDTIRALSADGTIRQLLTAHGAIYFNKLGLRSPDDFSDFAHSFGWRPHEDIGNPVRRTVLAKNVATANEGPNTQPVFPHNEFGLSPHYPAYVLFYCMAAADSGMCTRLPSYRV